MLTFMISFICVIVLLHMFSVHANVTVYVFVVLFGSSRALFRLLVRICVISVCVFFFHVFTAVYYCMFTSLCMWTLSLFFLFLLLVLTLL